MMKRLLIALLTLCAASASAQEEVEVDYGRTGFYLGLGGVFAIEQVHGEGVDVSNGGGIALRGGYRMTPHLATEIGFEWLDGFTAEGFGVKTDLESWSLTLGLRGYPLTRWRIQPYGLLAMGLSKAAAETDASALDARIDDTGGEIRLGGGVELYITENVALDLGSTYVLRLSDIKDFDYVSIGLGASYRF